MLKSRLLLKKIANFTDKLLQNNKQSECKIFRIPLNHVSDDLSVLFQFEQLNFKIFLNKNVHLVYTSSQRDGKF